MRSTIFVQFLDPLPSCFSCIICSAGRVVWASVLCALGLRCCLSPPWISPQRWSQLFPNIDEYFRRLCILELNVCSRRCSAVLLQDEPSHVRKSNRVLWQFKHNRSFDHCVQFAPIALPDFWSFSRFLAWRFIVWMKKRTRFPNFATFIRLVLDTFGRMPIIA